MLSCLLIAGALIRAGETAPDGNGAAGRVPARFDVLRTDDGTEYRNARVMRVDPDSLIIRHDGGMARVPLFDLSPEIQAQFDFDPFKGLDHFKKETEKQRELRWRIFWEGERVKAQQAEKEERAAVVEAAKLNWIPVEAQVLRRVSEGVLARCRKVVFVPTRVRDALGFEHDGPAERKLVAFSEGPVVLRFVLEGDGAGSGGSWKGYVSPSATGFPAVGLPGDARNAPVHKAVSNGAE